MRRSLLSLAVIATLLAPLQALAAIGPGCDGVRPASSCCCPMAPRDDDDRDAPGTPSVEGVCCCEIQPVDHTAPTQPQSLTVNPLPAAPVVTEAPAATEPSAERPGAAHTSARAPPPAGSLFGQHIALLI